MSKKQKQKQKQEWDNFVEDGQRYMICKHCEAKYCTAGEKAISVTCSSCTLKRCLSLKPIDELREKLRPRI